MKWSVMSNRIQPIFEVKALQRATPRRQTPRHAYHLFNLLWSTMFVTNASTKANPEVIPVKKRKTVNKTYHPFPSGEIVDATVMAMNASPTLLV